MKTLFIVAAHGNETFSIPVFQALEKKFPKDIYQYDWIVGNPEAVERNVRFVHVDMNRNAPGSPSSPYYEERRAAELITIAETFDLVVDVHGALSECGVCTIIPNPTLENILFASQFGCQNNVIWKTKDRQKKGPLIQHIRKPAIGLECGPKQDPSTIISFKKIVSQYLKRQGRLFLSKESKSKWFRVCGKLNEANFPEASTWLDFESYQTHGRSIIPFLTQNTYPDGSFFELDQFQFEDFFSQQMLTQ